MATAAAPEVEDTECGICNKQFTDPKLISCGHLLCRHCLLSWLTSQQDAPCPLCRRPIIDPDTRQRQSLEDIVDSFPTDVTMKIWVESEQLLNKDHTCRSCVTQAATSLCLHCHDFLCSSCVTIHGRLSSTRHHEVETLSSLTAEKMAASHSTPCHTHPKKLSQLYCSTHKVPICMLCATSKHRNCTELKDLEERAEETGAVWTEVVAALNAQEAKLDQAIQELDELFEEMEKKKAAVKEIDRTFKRLKSDTDKRQIELKELTLSMFGEAKKSVKDRKAGLLQTRGLVTTLRSIAERGNRMAASGGVSEMAVSVKERVKDIKSRALLPADAQIINTATLVIDPKAVSCVQKGLAELGQVHVRPADVAAVPEAVSYVQKALSELGQVHVGPADVAAQSVPFSFHDNCGKNIVLSNSRQTAERKGTNHFNSIVVSSKPMVRHRLYEVHVDERDAENGWYMMVGAVTTEPGHLTLPDKAWEWTSAVVFCSSCVVVHGTEIKRNVGQKLLNLPKGSRVGVMMDDSRSLHLYIDGKDQGDAGTQVSQPCSAFFEMFGPYRKVTALPVTVVPQKTSRQHTRTASRRAGKRKCTEISK